MASAASISGTATLPDELDRVWDSAATDRDPARLLEAARSEEPRVRLEAARVGAAVVGEDLGNVPDGLQEELAASGVLGCRLAMFEQIHHGLFRAPEDYTEAALASFGEREPGLRHRGGNVV